jgi:hypothetical protein
LKIRAPGFAGQTPAKPEPATRHLKKSGKVCGGLPTRRYGAGASFVLFLAKR